MSRKSKPGKGVHNDVDPQHLDNGNRIIDAENLPDKGNSAGGEVHYKLKFDEFTDGFEDCAAVEDGAGD